MQGTWRASGATLEASPNNIVITFDHGSTVDMNGIVAQGHGAYTIKSGTTTLDITANGGSVGYHFSVSGDTLTFRITSGIGNSMTFTRQE